MFLNFAPIEEDFGGFVGCVGGTVIDPGVLADGKNQTYVLPGVLYLPPLIKPHTSKGSSTDDASGLQMGWLVLTRSSSPLQQGYLVFLNILSPCFSITWQVKYAVHRMEVGPSGP